jgi:hypothetical protein
MVGWDSCRKNWLVVGCIELRVGNRDNIFLMDS